MSNFLTKAFQKYIDNKDIRNFKNKIFYYLFFRIVRKSLNSKIKVKIYNFEILASNSNTKQSHTILRKCDFEDLQELKLIDAISKKNKIFLFDCGSNFGFYSLFAANLNNNKIIAFEASPSTFLDLNQNVSLNKFKSIDTKNLAVSDINDKKIELFESDKDWESSVSHTNFINKNKVSIPTTTLDQYLNENNLENFSVIVKIDVEGHEMNVLRGCSTMIKKHEPLIIIEFSKHLFESGNNYSDLKKFLIDHNYVIYNSLYKQISIDMVINELDKLPKNMTGIGNNFLIKKNSKFEKIIKNSF